MPGITEFGTLDLSCIRQRVDSALDDFFDTKANKVDSPEQQELIALLRRFLAGGKRIRSTLCTVGWHAITGHEALPPSAVLRTAASLELFHAFALIHDDVMDNSASRRGMPTIHRYLAARYADRRSPQQAECLGISGAILLGDLALAWSDELLHAAGLTPAELAGVLPIIEAMRNEVMHGQYLDVITTGRPTADTARALDIIRYKTAKYTIERPMHIGVLVGGCAAEAIRAAVSAYALPIGEAFQLRDDLLGVFGSPEQTGKSILEDLRDGKHTYLMALALRHADSDQRNLLYELLGNPELDEHGAAQIRGVLQATGAPAIVEHMISNRRRRALAVLADLPFPPPAIEALKNFALRATARIS
ncbi:polyprenyl synthetase family protein [Streptomyces sp. NPDC006476]|uniref:polyprenyl synthetase family protein n=1 Tax=Streptomyces sp. NPDC006476 TaxID=3157175 RepID=UPI0033B67CEB